MANVVEIGRLIDRPIFVGTIFIPLFFYLAAGICGWFGLFIGYLFDNIFFFSWPLLILAFAFRLIFCLKVMRLVILNAFLIVLCAGGSYLGYKERPFLDAFEMRLKHEYINVSEMQKWATELLKTAKHEDYLIDESAYPIWATNPHFPKPFISVINDENIGGNGYVKIGWGSGVMGQWGLEIGKPTLLKNGRKWADGVYFFANPTPAGWGN